MDSYDRHKMSARMNFPDLRIGATLKHDIKAVLMKKMAYTALRTVTHGRVVDSYQEGRFQNR